MKLTKLMSLSTKNTFKSKKTILEICILSIALSIILFTLSFNNSLKKYWEKDIKYSMDHRTFLVNYNPDKINEKDAINKLEDYKYVEVVKPYSAYLISMQSNDYYEKNKENGFYLVGAIDEPLEISKGNNLSKYNHNDKVMICAKQFYPYFEADIDKYSLKNSIDLSEKVGEKLSISFLGNSQKEEFTLVGVYDIKNMNTLGNTCYTKWDTVMELNMKYQPDIYQQKENESNPIVVVINSTDNEKKFIDKIEKDGFSTYGSVVKINTAVGDDILNKIIIISIILVIIIVVIIIFIVLKENQKRKYEYGLMKVFGYKTEDLICIKIIEETLKSSVSLFAALPFCILIIEGFNNLYIKNQLLINGFTIKFSMLNILLVCFFQC